MSRPIYEIQVFEMKISVHSTVRIKSSAIWSSMIIINAAIVIIELIDPLNKISSDVRAEMPTEMS